ncbi:MAG TPA: hypothetical protein PKD61_38230, partial [Polyangiaceae bacterium]|nr:hypothetical protein [Polyangiaceae bacterium]
GPADPERERAKTVGFVIGTLVGEAEREPTTKAATPKQPAQIEYVAKTQPPQEPSAERAGLQLFLELGAIVDSALDSGAPRWGGAARLGAVIHGPWEAYLGAGYGMRPRDEQGLRTRWYSLEFGAGVAHPLTSTLTLTAAVAPAAERLQADVGEPRPDEGGRWVFGLGARLGARSNVTDRISIVFALQSMLRESGTVITLDGRDAGRQPSLSLGGSLGVRLMPF